jgi:hypothetical protein
MKEINEENWKNGFLKSLVNYGIVIRADFRTIEEIKMLLAHRPDVDVVYQRYSLNKLYIRDDGDSDVESN